MDVDDGAEEAAAEEDDDDGAEVFNAPFAEVVPLVAEDAPD